MRRGDNFNKPTAYTNTVNPNEERWSDQVLYLLKQLLGKDLPKNDQAVLQITGNSLGERTDDTADIATLEQNPKTAFSQIQLLKAITVLSSRVQQNTDDVEESLVTVNSFLGSIQNNTNQVESLIQSSINELQISNESLQEIETAVDQLETINQSIRDRLDDPIEVTLPQPLMAQYTNEFAVSEDNAAVEIEIPAITDKRRIISSIIYSYTGSDPVGMLTVNEENTTLFEISITSSGPGTVTFPKPLRSEVDGTLTIVLSAGGTGIIGRINVLDIDAE